MQEYPIPMALGGGAQGAPKGAALSNQYPEHFREEFTTPGAGTFTLPQGVTEVYIECWGGGGGGGGGSTATTATTGLEGGGGGGGAYAAGGGIFTAGATINFTVGAGGAGGAIGADGVDGGDTSCDGGILADGGKKGHKLNVAGAGGTTAGSTGTVKHAGGDGATGAGLFSPGAGGSSGGPIGDGTNSGNGQTSPATARAGYGGGGGTVPHHFGFDGGAPGGGGGGSVGGGGSQSGGSGANGKVVISFPTPP